MPWDAKSFAENHNHKLKGAAATKAAAMATAMVERGVPEGEAIATANARAEGKKPKKRRPRAVGKDTQETAAELDRRLDRGRGK